MQMSFEVDPTAPVSLQTQLIGQISTSITTGRLKPGTRLPGTRALSEQLGVSRNTVLLAYADLAAEGYM
jgi:GntR family transcriptional regulator / MocR family aminotransferase